MDGARVVCVLIWHGWTWGGLSGVLAWMELGIASVLTRNGWRLWICVLTWMDGAGVVCVLTWHGLMWGGLSGDMTRMEVGWSVCSPGMGGARVGPICVFLRDRVELCLAGWWVSRLMISQGGGMYLVLKQSICKQLDKKSMFPEEQNGVWGSQSPEMGLEFSSWRKKQTIFFPLHSSLFDS